jgi:aryl-alcohol dehydrogenase (NADP+)
VYSRIDSSCHLVDCDNEASRYIHAMDHNRLGRTGLKVSRLCLGTMTFGLQCDEATSFAIMDRAAEGGIDFIDTSNVYPLGGGPETKGRTEEIVGKWLKGRRDEFILATKCFGQMGPAPMEHGNSRRHILGAVEDSLRRLQTDYIDLYQLHGYDNETPIEETLDTLNDLVRQGKVRYIGCSNFLTYQLVRAIGKSETLGLARFDSVQPRYNLLFRQIEREMLPFCGEDGVGVIPYNPIAGGLLSGKHNREAAPPEGTRFTLGAAAQNYQDRYWHDKEFDTVQALLPLAQAAGVSLVTLAVAWVLANPVITAPIIGASRPDQLDASLQAAEYVLDPALKVQLDELTNDYRMGDAPR